MLEYKQPHWGSGQYAGNFSECIEVSAYIGKRDGSALGLYTWWLLNSMIGNYHVPNDPFTWTKGYCLIQNPDDYVAPGNPTESMISTSRGLVIAKL